MTMMCKGNFQSCPDPLLWCDDDASANQTCDPEAVHLLNGLLGWWDLTDHISAIKLGPNPGSSGIPFIDQSIGNPVAYQHDTGRGGMPGCAIFTGDEGSRLTAIDPPNPAVGYFIHNPFTVGLWVRLDAKGIVNGKILAYALNPTTVRYQLTYDLAKDRFAFKVAGFPSGITTVFANAVGSPVIGQWYWIELWYELDTLIAGIRVAPFRTTGNQPLQWIGDTAVVSGGITESPGDLNLGSYGSGGGTSFYGAIAGVGIWDRALTDCERGRLCNPTDYPFEPGGSLLTEQGEARLTEAGEMRGTE